MSTFYVSDCHFGHEAIISLCNRPFKTVEEMNETLINNWNSCVKHDDTIYHLGDFAWRDHKAILSRLHGKIFFILGNHDKGLQQIFTNLPQILDIKVNGQFITLCHYPMKSWNKSHYGAWQLYGHHHSNLLDDEETWSTDVGMDRWNCKPVSFEQLQELFSKRSNKLLKNHHKKE